MGRKTDALGIAPSRDHLHSRIFGIRKKGASPNVREDDPRGACRSNGDQTRDTAGAPSMAPAERTPQHRTAGIQATWTAIHRFRATHWYYRPDISVSIGPSGSISGEDCPKVRGRRR